MKRIALFAVFIATSATLLGCRFAPDPSPNPAIPTGQNGNSKPVAADTQPSLGGTSPAKGGGVLPEVDTSVRWALLIGAKDYQHLTPLRFCDRDMQRLASVLVSHAGYQRENIVLLAGNDQQPTRQTMLEALDDFFAKVQSRDTVLLAFSGHGMVSDGAGYLMPIDGKPEDPAETGIPISKIHEYLSNTRDLTKFVVLDACHSGSAKSGSTPSPKDLIGAEGTFELLSCGANQESFEDPHLDGGHGVFSYYLTQALLGQADLPNNGGNGDAEVTFPEAYSYVHGRVREHSRARFNRVQEPYQRANGSGIQVLSRYDPRRLPLVGHADLVTLPGLNGDWYVQETPWLAPFVRRKLPSYMPASRVHSVSKLLPEGERRLDTGLYDPVRLRVHADLLQGYERFASEEDSHLQILLEQMRRLAEVNLSEKERIKLIEDLRKLNDPHSLAVFMHSFGMPEAGEVYVLADEQYHKDGETRTPQYALFLADHARWLSKEGEHSKAAAQYAVARSIVPNAAEAPLFHISCWCQQANARRKTGPWREVLHCLDQAQTLANQLLAQDHPYRAYVQERRAWAFMDVWRLEEAEQAFRAAIATREAIANHHQPTNSLDLQNERSLLHNNHGLAMNLRYRGRTAEAIEKYQNSVDRIKPLLRQALRENSPHAQQFSSRLANSYVRLADCYLYSTPIVPDQADLALVGALQQYAQMPAASRGTSEAVALGKHAMALAAGGDSDSALRPLTKLTSLQEEVLAPKQAADVEPYRQVAQGLIQLANGADGQGRATLRAAIQQFSRDSSKRNINRDDLDLLLFATSALIRADQKEANSNGELLQDTSKLFHLVPDHFITDQTLPYLQPHFNEGLLTLLETKLPQQQDGDSAATLPREWTAYALLTLIGDREIKKLKEEDVLLLFHPPKSPRLYILHQSSSGIRAYRAQYSRGQPLPPMPAELRATLEKAGRPLAVVWNDSSTDSTTSPRRAFEYELSVKYRILSKSTPR